MIPAAPLSQRPPMKPPCLALFLAGLALASLAGGCATNPGSGPTARSPLTRTNPFNALTMGMSAAEVRALVGEPREIKADPGEGSDAQLWRYQHKLDEVVRQVPIGTRELPAINPITGQPIVIVESVMTDEFSTIYQDIDLLMIGDRILDIRRSQRVDRRTR